MHNTILQRVKQFLNVKTINLENLKSEKCQPPYLLRKPAPAPFFYPFFSLYSTHATIFSLLIITLYRNGTIQQKGITYYMTSFGVLHDVRLTNLNLFRWRHWEITSDLLFSKFLSGSSIIANFSFKQLLHFFKVGLYILYCLQISHVSLGACCFCFKVQYCTDKVVPFLELIKLNDFLWFA